MTKRQFGNIRKLPSGRWQASYWLDGRRYVADRTFPAKADASAWLSAIQTDVLRGVWVDPDAGRILFGTYADLWLKQRHNLRPRTRESYEILLRVHLKPVFANKELSRITSLMIRAWYAEATTANPKMAPKSYRVLRTILTTAVEDGLLSRNPCIIKGAGQEH